VLGCIDCTHPAFAEELLHAVAIGNDFSDQTVSLRRAHARWKASPDLPERLSWKAGKIGPRD
jgi:hypothetical protein